MLWKTLRGNFRPIYAVLLFSAFLNLYRLHPIGWHGLGNSYYAAAVQSMMESWHNFFYLAFDPSGFVSLDKAPLAFWLQALLAKVFGFSGLALLLPQIFAGIASVYLVYRLVRRPFGESAALLASLALAVMPVSVMIQRNNAPDALMTLALLLAAAALVRSIERSSLPWLFCAAALVGIAFNIKMLQILLVIPALGVLYLWSCPWPWRKRLLAGLGAVALAVLVASPWVLAVDLTPPGVRPYVGGSANNTVTDLIFNYNGLARLWGEDFNFYNGPPGWLRLFNDKLGGQISWLLPLALLGTGVAAWQLVREDAREKIKRRNALVLWLAWLVPSLVYFSVATFFHAYYMATFAPAVAALYGISAIALWRFWKRATIWQQLAVGIVLLACAGVQLVLLAPFPGWKNWLVPLIAGMTVLGLAGLLAARRWKLELQSTAFAVCLLTLLVAPLTWTLIPLSSCTNETLPYAGPQVFSPGGVCQPFQKEDCLKPEWLAVFEHERGAALYLGATHDMGIAMCAVLDTGQPFLALGGYRGSDPILSVGEFAAMVERGELRYYTAIKDEVEYPVQKDIRQWVKAHCPVVPTQGIFIWGPCETGN